MLIYGHSLPTASSYGQSRPKEMHILA